MTNDTTLITSRRKAEFLRACKRAQSAKEVQTLSKELTRETMRKHELEGTSAELAKALFAVGLSYYYVAKAETVEEYFLSYIRHKLYAYRYLNDTGALGDATETTVHLLAMREHWRTKIQNLHVAKIGATDVQIDGVKYEVGHNAKVWADSTLEDAMKGPFAGVIYGMIPPEIFEKIYRVMTKDMIKGITLLASQLYVFKSKADFLQVMQNELGRSETIKYRSDLHQMITAYTGSKQKAWNLRMKRGEFPTLTQLMKSLGPNDYLE